MSCLGCVVEFFLSIGIVFYGVFDFLENYFYEDSLWVNLFVEEFFLDNGKEYNEDNKC